MSLSTKIETTANLGTVVVAALLSAILIKVYLLPGHSPQNSQSSGEVSVGTNLRL